MHRILCTACAPADRAPSAAAPEFGRYQIVQLQPNWIVRLDTKSGAMEVFVFARPQDLAQGRPLGMGFFTLAQP
jgi:hypothetical protein